MYLKTTNNSNHLYKYIWLLNDIFDNIQAFWKGYCINNVYYRMDGFINLITDISEIEKI